MNGTLTGTTTLGQSGPGSNGNEGLLHSPQNSKESLKQIFFKYHKKENHGLKPNMSK